VGLLNRVIAWRRRRQEKLRSVVTATQHVGHRICRFEQIEPRQLLNGAPIIQLGAVYDDAHSGQDTVPNTFTVTWSGGAAGTELTQLTISTDPNGNPVVQPGDPFFNTSPGAPGVYGSNPLAIVSNAGFTATGQNPDNGSTILTLNFNGFTAGKQLVFTIDVDDLGPHGADATVNGHEFERSTLIGVFAAPHYQDFTATGTFYDVFDPAEHASGLPLPPDSYIGGLIGGTTVNTVDQSVYTAGAFASGQQTPLPITLEGDVYYNPELDNQRHSEDPSIAGVQLTLLQNVNGTYVSTGMTTTTDANGHYKFSGVLPGEYQVVETQPSGYFAVGSSPGSYGGASYGVAVDPNLLSQIDVLGGEDVANLDFSQSLPNSIAGTVRVPPIGDCTTDPTAPGLGGVTVQLLDSNGNVLQTTTTATDGSYRFTNLRAGNYTVHELLPTGYYAVDADLGTVNGAADGTTVDLQTTGNIVLTSAQNGVQYDFCLQQPVSIAGTVRVPPLGDCNTDPTAPGLGGVTVQLLDSQGNLLQTTTTAADGTYRFANLHAGTYTVHELLPAGYYAVDADLGMVNGAADGTTVDLQTTANIVLMSGQNGVQYDFCLQQPVSIAGTVRVPPIGDCTADPTAPGLGGVTVQLLDGQGNLLQTTTTAADGTYRFTNLHVGTYTVHELLPAGYYAVDADLGMVNGVADGTTVDLQTTANIVLTSGENGVQYDFCLQQPVSITGTVRVPPLGDCTTDASAPGLGGVTVQLLDGQGNLLQTTTTAADGTYRFTNLHVGTYTVHELLPAGYYAVDADLGMVNGAADGTTVDLQTTSNIVLTSGEHGVQYDFCLQQPVSITGTVRVPPLGDCTTDPTAPGLGGVTVQLLDSQGNLLQTTTTAADGTYGFTNLHAGTYTVHELLPAGYYAVDADLGVVNGTADGTTIDLQTTANIALTSGEHGVQYDFCLQQPVSVTGTVRVPPVGDCTTDPTAPGLGGVTIQLLDGQSNLLETTTTAANGTYHFTNLRAGTYTVHELLPGGYLAVDADLGVVNGAADGTTVDLQTTGNIVLTSGRAGTQYDFCIQQPVSISGVVKSEIYGDCETTPSDPPVQGVTIQLLDSQGNVIGTATTNAAGVYTFDNLAPGTYSVHDLLPSGWFYADSHVGNAGGVVASQSLLASVALTNGVHGTGYNFCLLPGGTISGYVFQDGQPISVTDLQQELPGILANLPNIRSGVRQPGDPPIAGVTLELADGAGVLLLDQHGNPIQAVTDANGFYQFTNLPPSTYTVIELPPSGFVTGVNRAGSLGGLAINPTLISSGALSLDVSLLGVSASDALLQVVGTNDAIAAIPLGAGQSSVENDFSVVVFAQPVPFVPQPPLAPQPLYFPPPALPSPPAPSPPPAAPPVVAPYINWNGAVAGMTWHLSVVDAGWPRGDRRVSDARLRLTRARTTNFVWNDSGLRESVWTLNPEPGETSGPFPTALDDAGGLAGQAIHTAFGARDAVPVTGDFNGDGTTEIGVFRDGQWFLDLNGNGMWDEGDLWAKLGAAGDQPVTGDWDGDGKTDIGIYGPAWPRDPRAVANEPGLPHPENVPTGAHKNMPPEHDRAPLGWRTIKRTRDGVPRADLIDHVFLFGTPGDVPVAGDWSGAGVDTIGVFRNGQFILDVDGDGKRGDNDLTVQLGQRGDRPVVGDFNGDGVDELGVYRDGLWLIDINHDGVLDEHDMRQELGGADDHPVVGDWNGDGCDQIGIHQDASAPAKLPYE
jgi:hypothetical protein